MPTTFHLRVWTRFLAPVEEVWRLKTDLGQIAAEFAPLLSFRLPKELSGLSADAPPPMPLGPLPARLGPPGLPLLPWPLTVAEVDPRRRYVDTSANALYRDWRHEHRFEPTPDGCRYIDAVTFTPALPAQKLAAILTRRLFLHRHLRASRLLPADPQATAVGVLRVEDGKAGTEVIDDR